MHYVYGFNKHIVDRCRKCVYYFFYGWFTQKGKKMELSIKVTLDHDGKYHEDTDMSSLNVKIGFVGTEIFLHIPDIKDVKKFRNIVNNGKIQKIIDVIISKGE